MYTKATSRGQVYWRARLSPLPKSSSPDRSKVKPSPIFFWACEIGLDTAFRIENAMGTYLKYARHRVFNPKPPSEAQFDKPRQRGLCRAMCF